MKNNRSQTNISNLKLNMKLERSLYFHERIEIW